MVFPSKATMLALLLMAAPLFHGGLQGAFAAEEKTVKRDGKYNANSKAQRITTESTSNVTCGVDEMAVVLDILTDEYPSETYWNISNVETNDTIVGGSYLDSQQYELFKYEYCFPIDSCLIYEIYDTFGDGILYPGGFNLTVDDEVLATSIGNFSYYDAAVFGLGCPSEVPTTSPAPTNPEVPTSSPTYAPCEAGEVFGMIQVLTDSAPNETSWVLQAHDAFTLQPMFPIASDNYGSDEEFTYHEYGDCIPLSGCYSLIFFDHGGDGIAFPGGYNASLDGEVLMTSYDNPDGNFGDSEMGFFGNCTTQSPTSSPAPSGDLVPLVFYDWSPSFLLGKCEGDCGTYEYSYECYVFYIYNHYIVDESNP